VYLSDISDTDAGKTNTGETNIGKKLPHRSL